MGKARGKAKARKPLTDAERSAALGADPFAPAYELLYGMIETVFTKAGGVNHELIGLDFAAGKPTGVNVLVVRRPEDVPHLRAEMLARWPMVAHVFEAWSAPDTSMPPAQHPQRYDVVSVLLHTADMVAAAECRVHPREKRIERGELKFPARVEGRLAPDLPPRH